MIHSTLLTARISEEWGKVTRYQILHSSYPPPRENSVSTNFQHCCEFSTFDLDLQSQAMVAGLCGHRFYF